MRLFRYFLVASLLGLQPAFAVAASFSDVTSAYVHADAIAKLADLKVVQGNPDGTFKPHDPVNRAAYLVLLYRAMGRTPTAVASTKFSDVQPGSWYELYVKDAAANGYVAGYPDGTFKPARPITRAEGITLALRMLAVPSADFQAVASVYTDVKAEDWFSAPVRTALAKSVLPIPGQTGPEFKPHTPLERGEAAAYIWNALHPKDVVQSVEEEESSSSVSSEAAESSSSSATVKQDEERKRIDLTKADAEEAKRLKERIKSVPMPFTEKGTFEKKLPFTYRFNVTSSFTIDIVATLDAGAAGSVSCRLYRIESSGFSSRYHLGMEEEKNCYIRAALTPGEYHLQLQPSAENVKYSVAAVKTTGDGNDGFSEAKLLGTTMRIDVLEANDLEDWFTFKVTAEKERTITLTSSSDLGCLVYPLDDVDLFGFAGPECGKPYLYPVGTYMIDVRHAKPRAMKMTYSIGIK